jgi:hypothetical protein
VPPQAVESVLFTLAAVMPSACSLRIGGFAQRGLIGQVGQADIGMRLSRASASIWSRILANWSRDRPPVFCNSAVKAGGLTQTAHDGRLQRIEFQIAEAAGERLGGAAGDGLGGVLRARAVVPVGHGDEAAARFWPLVPPPPPPATVSTVSTLGFSWLRKYFSMASCACCVRSMVAPAGSWKLSWPSPDPRWAGSRWAGA